MSPGPIRLAHLAGQPAPSAIPLYGHLAADDRVQFTVLYGSTDGVRPYDDGYGSPIAWDADLLEGYDSIFLDAAERTPGLGTHFWAARNWDVVPLLMRRRWDVLSMAGYYSATYVMAALAQRATGGALLFREEQTTLDPRSLVNVIAKQIALRPYLGLGHGLYISTENRRWLERHKKRKPGCSPPRTPSTTRSSRARPGSWHRRATSCVHRSASIPAAGP